VVTIVLCDLGRSWIGKFLNESRADALRLVECFATPGTALTADLDYLIRIRYRPPLWIVSWFLSRCTVVCTWLFVVLVSAGRGRLSIVRLILARWRVRSLVSPKLGPQPFVLFSELLVFLTELLILLLKRNQSLEDLLLGRLGRDHYQARRDGLQVGDHPSEVCLLA